MEILIQNPLAKPVNLRQIRALARRLLKAEGCSDRVEVSILFTDDAQIAELNKSYRDMDGPTDVLSFSQIEGDEEFACETEEAVLGDVVISVDTAQRQAVAEGHSADEEISVLLVHGLLHLLGYDHAEPADANRMFGRQAEILAASVRTE